MVPYIIAITLIEASRIFRADSKRKRFAVSLFCAIIFILLLGMRHPSMGQDLLYMSKYGYLGGFQNIAKASWEIEVYQNYEWGYIIFNKLISVFTTDTQVFLAVCAACSILPFAYVIYKYSDDIQTSYIVFWGNPIFTMLFSGLRQGLAIGILFLTIGLIKNRKFIRFFLTVCIAAQIHSSAYVFLLAYPIYHIGLLNQTVKTVLVAAIPVAVVLRRILFTIFTSLISSKKVVDDNGAINLFLLSFFFLLFIFYKVKTENKELNGFIKIYYFACLTLVFTSVNAIALRVTFYFIDILILLVPMLYMRDIQSADAEIQSHSKGVLIAFVNLLFIVLGLFFIITTSWAKAYPYYFFWE